MIFSSKNYHGKIQEISAPPLLAGAHRYSVQEPGDGFEARFSPGTLTGFEFLTADFLLEGTELAVFRITLQEGEDGPAASFSFGLLNQCQARLSMPLEAVLQNTWMYPRRGALLKPLVWGQRVDLKKVDRLNFHLYRSGGKPVIWWMTELTAVVDEPPVLEAPLLPAGRLLDRLGQSHQRDWPGRTRTPAELAERLKAQLEMAGQARPPAEFSRWGGWKENTWPATGFFHTAYESGRWWLVDPDGHPFWSTGLDCVGMNIDSVISGLERALEWLPPPEGPFGPAYQDSHWGQKAFNYLAANFIRAFPDDWRAKWETVTFGLLRTWGFNTVANWSDWRAASRAGMPYVRPLDEMFTGCSLVYRSFPDVFDPQFDGAVEEYAQQLSETIHDPALIGYFLMNEPTWGFSNELLAEGMLYNTPNCASRRALADFLEEKYRSAAGLREAWKLDVGFDQVARGSWEHRLPEEARPDLEEFSTRMVARYFGLLSAACKRVDPNHLNLGARYYTSPPDWVAKGMLGFDVFSINCYRQQVPADELRRIHDLLNLPVLIGEWHFGALDVGLPGSGIGHVTNQDGRGQAYRVYVENAAAIPWCVGVHYFTLYDQSAVGRFDGENYNIGFLDVCNRPYEPLVDAARQTHERLYRLAAGELLPYADLPEYLPMVFL